MMIEYFGWKCLLVGKLIESWSQIVTQNDVKHIIKQCVWSDMFFFFFFDLKQRVLFFVTVKINEINSAHQKVVRAIYIYIFGQV